MISAMSSRMISSYINYVSSASSNAAEKMFRSLSVELGGDGTSISKTQVKDYIKRADDGIIKVGKNKLDCLKNLEKNWDKVFEDKKAISLEDFQKNMGIFLPIFLDDSTDNNEYITEKLKFYKEKADKFKELLEKVKPDEEDEKITKQDLQNYLKNLLEKNEEEDDEDEKTDEIDFITNLIAEFDNITGGKDYMQSLKKETEYTV